MRRLSATCRTCIRTVIGWQHTFGDKSRKRLTFLVPHFAQGTPIAAAAGSEPATPDIACDPADALALALRELGLPESEAAQLGAAHAPPAQEMARWRPDS
ncbi:MAG: hypothetical protein WC692_09750 [Erythrobacter sp.]|jgi:hypothetical protein